MSWCPHNLVAFDDHGNGPVLKSCGEAARMVPVLGIPAQGPPGSAELSVFDIPLTEKYCSDCAPSVTLGEILERTPGIARAIHAYFGAMGWGLPDWDKALVTFVTEKAAAELGRPKHDLHAGDIGECAHCRLRATVAELRGHSCQVIRATKRGLGIRSAEPLDIAPTEQIPPTNPVIRAANEFNARQTGEGATNA